jgi:hypothetical protein
MQFLTDRRVAMNAIYNMSRRARRQLCLALAALVVSAGLSVVSFGVDMTFRVAQAEVMAQHA